jgi:hypothetical protein
MNRIDFKVDVLIQGFPGKAVCHGGLGWSTVALIRGGEHIILVDVGSFGMRRISRGWRRSASALPMSPMSS